MIRKIMIVMALAAFCLHIYYQESIPVPLKPLPVIVPGDEMESTLRVSSVTLPNILYAGEKRSISISISNRSGKAIDCAITLELDGLMAKNVSVPSDKDETVVFGFQCPVRERLPLQCSIKVQSDGNHTQYFLLVDGRGDISQIHTNRVTFQASNNIRTVLVNDYENETTYRRWAPVKWAVASYERQDAKRFLWIPSEITGSPKLDGVTQIPYRGNPFKAMLRAMEHVPEKDASVVAIGWGFEEAFRRMPVENCIRAMDLVIDRARQKNPATQFMLLTPPPITGGKDLTGRYAKALRVLAREHHLPVIDVHRAILAFPGWKRLYSLDDDDIVSQLYPSTKGQAIIRKLVIKGLQQ